METLNKQELFDYYNERAPEYEEFYDGHTSARKIDPALIRKEIAEIKEILPDYVKGSILDVACGTGYWLPYYYKDCPRITLVDQSENVLSECRKKIAELGIADKTEVLRADIFSHRFTPQKFDTVLIAFLISHFSDEEIDGLLESVRAAVNPGGSFIFIDNIWNEMVESFAFRKYGTHTRYLKDGRQFRILKRYFTPDDMSELAGKHNFSLDLGYSGEVFLLACGTFRGEKP